jgi:hypothetical protein
MLDSMPPASPGKELTDISADWPADPSALKLANRISLSGCSFHSDGTVHFGSTAGGAGTNDPLLVSSATNSFGMR